jgi:hypothetical protein
MVYMLHQGHAMRLGGVTRERLRPSGGAGPRKDTRW